MISILTVAVRVMMRRKALCQHQRQHQRQHLCLRLRQRQRLRQQTVQVPVVAVHGKSHQRSCFGQIFAAEPGVATLKVSDMWSWLN